MTNLDSVLKNRDITLSTKVCIVKAMVFSSSHVQMWEVDHKECWVSENWCFRTVGLEKTLESPLDCKEINPEYSLEAAGKESACNVGDLGSIPRLGRCPGEGNGYPLQYSCLQNSMHRGAWQATVHGVAKSWTWLSRVSLDSVAQGDVSPRPYTRGSQSSSTVCLIKLDTSIIYDVIHDLTYDKRPYS